MNTTSFIAGLRTAVDANWPLATVNGIYLGEELARIAFEAKAAAGELPLAVIETDLAESDDFSTLDVTAFEGDVIFNYITTDAELVEDDLIPLMETLRDYLWNTGLSYGQVLAKPRIRFDLDLPVNQHFLRQARPFSSAAVIARVVACEV